MRTSQRPDSWDALFREVAMGLLRVGAGAVILLAANACAPLVVQQGARTVKPGGVQVGMSAGSITSSYEEETKAKGNSTYAAVSPNAWARFGIASNVDAGLQFYGSGARVDAKFAPLQSDGMALAIGAGVGGGAQQTTDSSGSSDDSTDDHQWFGDVGLLFTAALGPAIDLNVAAKYIAGESYSSQKYGAADGFPAEEYKESTQLTGFGGALAVAIKRGTWAISPEVAVYQLTNTDTETPDSTEDTLVIVPSVGFSVGF